jgi:N-methylhydantoinase A/acetophenone carboxylase
MRYGSQYNMTRVQSAKLRLESGGDVEALCDAFTRRYGEIYSPEATFPAGGINIENVFLTAQVRRKPFDLAAAALASASPDAAARTGERNVYWDPELGRVATPVYDAAKLRPGNKIKGPCIVESPVTTFVVAPGWDFHIDAWNNGVLERREEKQKTSRRKS